MTFPEHVRALARTCTVGVDVDPVDIGILGDWLEENGEPDLARCVRARPPHTHRSLRNYHYALAWILWPEPAPFVDGIPEATLKKPFAPL